MNVPLPSRQGRLGASWRLGKQAEPEQLQMLAARYFKLSYSSTNYASIHIGHHHTPVYSFQVAVNTMFATDESTWYELTEVSPCCGKLRAMGKNTVPEDPFKSKFDVASLDACCSRAYAMPAGGMYASHESLLCLSLDTSERGAQILTNELETRFSYYANPLAAALGALTVRDQLQVLVRSLMEPPRRGRKILWEEM